MKSEPGSEKPKGSELDVLMAMRIVVEYSRGLRKKRDG